MGRSPVVARWALVAAAAALVAGCGAPAPGPDVPPNLPTTSAAAPLPGGPTGGPAPSPAGVPAVTTTRPCVGAPAPARWRHVVWIWFENKASALGSSDAPYLSGLAAACASAADAHGVTHPSLPNYLAATSGSTHGVTDDAGPAAHPLAGPSLFSQVADAGLSWRAYQESMPTPCATTSRGRYAVKHNPAVYYTAVRADCARWDVGLDQLAADLASDRMPAFAFVTPDLCHDMHDCSVATGDAWLRGMLPTLLASPAYLRGDTAVFITWDEDEGSTANRVPLLVVAPSVTPGTVLAGRLDHYALLRTTEHMLGLPPLGNAAAAPLVGGL